MNTITRPMVAFLAMTALSCQTTMARETFNFNMGWTIDNQKHVTLPHAWNEDEAYKVRCNELSEGVRWYRKHFSTPKLKNGERVLIEFEGAKQAAEVYVNGKQVGLSENGIMAFGFDITPYLKKKDNVIEVKTDNSIKYREKSSNSRFQWNYTEFNANYGGITKNVKLHIMPAVHQTLPLWSNLKTTGVYVYASDFDIPNHTAVAHVESQVKNESKKAVKRALHIVIEDKYGNAVADFKSDAQTILPGQMTVLKASHPMQNLHFWSWGYGYLYSVKTYLVDEKTAIGDPVTTVTGFRKTEFKDGMIYLNDRVIQVHGYAQRSTNGWPLLGNAVPAWLSDYSNKVFVESGGNVVRWMHITPGKQDVESCDRVGLIQAMPAGDAEKDAVGRQWEQRVEVMRDAIIYNRNNPSILFYECGNNNINDDHMAEMKAVRDEYDPRGGRAIGSRNMLSTKVAEYGGEMLYVNKSRNIPMWMMEYCRDEGARKYWNSWSYPFHKEGDGPLYRNAPAPAYNHNMDELAAEFVRRWYEFYQERPGQGTKVCSGGVKIVFSESQTHARGSVNYRTSGVVDAMRIPKDAFYVHQVMWDGWVDDLKPRTHIVGHWNYKNGQILPKLYVASNGDSVRLSINGKTIGKEVKCQHSDRFLWTFDDVKYEAGTILAESYTRQPNGSYRKTSEHSIVTTGEPDHLKITKIENPTGWKADGADVAMIQVEAVDKQGRRCPLADNTIRYAVTGEAEWRGGVTTGREDNYAGDKNLPLEAGVHRVLLRSTMKAGDVKVTLEAEGLPKVDVALRTMSVDGTEGNALTDKRGEGLSTYFPSDGLECDLTRGETPTTPSFIPTYRNVDIVSVTAGSNVAKAKDSYDECEATTWTSSSKLAEAWITYTLAEDTPLSEVCLKMGAFRSKAYPIEIYAGDVLVWRGYTPKSLGYVRLPLQKTDVKSKTYTIKLVGSTDDGDAFGGVKEMDKRNDEKKVAGGTTLRIIEAEFLAPAK